MPGARRLDTRGGLDTSIRCGQTGATAGDVVDPRLPAGALAVPPGRDWSMVATVAGAAGLAMGSHRAVVAAPDAEHVVAGVDTRMLMTRQVWGARVLQRGAAPPDSPDRPRWTFTLFPGEEVVDGMAVSGTVPQAGFGFGSASRIGGIASARVCPALPI